jgi:hypothetical protein
VTAVSGREMQRQAERALTIKLIKLAPEHPYPGNRSVVTPGVVKQALNAIGGYPISRLPDLLEGRISASG